MSTTDYLSEQAEKRGEWVQTTLKSILVKDFGPNASRLGFGPVRTLKSTFGGPTFVAMVLSPEGKPTGVELKLWTLQGKVFDLFVDSHAYPTKGWRQIFKPWRSIWEVAAVFDELL